MKLSGILKTALFAAPLVLATMAASNSAFTQGRGQGACNGNPKFKVTITVENKGGKAVVSVDPYTLDFAKNGGPSGSPLIFICLKGDAKFVPGKEVIWKNNPGVFGVDNRRNPPQQFVVTNKNNVKAGYNYSVTVKTSFEDEMVIDPRVQNGGGGN